MLTNDSPLPGTPNVTDNEAIVTSAYLHKVQSLINGPILTVLRVLEATQAHLDLHRNDPDPAKREYACKAFAQGVKALAATRALVDLARQCGEMQPGTPSLEELDAKLMASMDTDLGVPPNLRDALNAVAKALGESVVPDEVLKAASKVCTKNSWNN